MSDSTQLSAPELGKPAWRKLATRKIWILPVWAYILIVFIVVVALSGGGDTTDDQTATEPEPTATPAPSPEPEPTATPAPSPEPEPTAESTATEPSVGLSPAEAMRALTPLLMAQAGYPMSSTGEIFWELADLELHDDIGGPFCDSVRESSFEVAALLLYEDAVRAIADDLNAEQVPTVGLLEAFGVDSSYESAGAILGLYIGAYCPEQLG